jgi:phosphoenolpyruvate phosphomutase
MGLLKMSASGVAQLKAVFAEIGADAGFRKMRMAELFRLLVARGKKIEVVYVRGHWLDVDDMHDVVAASNFGGSGQYR